MSTSSLRHLLFATMTTACLWLQIGCGAPQPDFVEVKRIDEVLTDEEIAKFLAVVEHLPEKTLPEMPLVFAPPPDWDPSRSLAVKELVRKESEIVRDSWDWTRLSLAWEDNRDLSYALSAEGMTIDQFAGLTLCIGAGLSRLTLEEGQDPGQILSDSLTPLSVLRSDQRSFSALTQSEQHEILTEAIWITRAERAHQLMQVQNDSLPVLRGHREALQTLFPSEFQINPLNGIADRRTKEGVPFETLPESPRDDELKWSKANAIIGTDVILDDDAVSITIEDDETASE